MMRSGETKKTDTKSYKRSKKERQRIGKNDARLADDKSPVPGNESLASPPGSWVCAGTAAGSV